MEGNQKKLHPLEHGVYNDNCCIGVIGGVCGVLAASFRWKCGVFTVIFLADKLLKNEIRHPRAESGGWVLVPSLEILSVEP